MREAARRSRSQIVRFADFEVDLRVRELRKGGARIRLQEQPFQVLAVLLQHPGEVVTREELRQRLWHSDTFVDFDNSLNTAINKIREALCDSAEEPHFVETLPRRGYRFIGSADEAPTASKGQTSIAVLPFVFLGELEEPRTLSLGFADALITTLGNFGNIVVLPTAAILNYAAGTNPAQACRDLGVRYVLQANIQKLGTHWRVSVQLFDGVCGKVTFSDKYDFTHEDLFEVQDEIGHRVVESLDNRFRAGIRKSRDRYSRDAEAYKEFVSGLQESYSDRPEILHSAVQHLSGAVERDPKFALAHATLSYVCMNLHFTLDPDRVWLQKAEYHCRRALALDSKLPEGHFAQAYILWSPAKNFQHADAIAALEQVLALQPNFEHAHNRLASICLHIGRLREAQAAFEQGQRSNPKKLLSHNINWVYLFSGDFARAREGVEVWLQESPGHKYALWFRPLPALLAGDLDMADQRVSEALCQLPDEPLIVSLQGLLYARRKQTDLALQSVRKASDFARSLGHTHHTYYQIASVYALLGEIDKAMVWLERSADTGFACWPFFQLDPHLASLRREPGFTRLVANLQREFGTLEIRRL